MKEKTHPAIVLANDRPSSCSIHENLSDWAIDAEDMLRKVAAQNQELIEALQGIAEYWNQDRNDAAMFDACHYAIDTAMSAIAKAEGVQQ